MTREWCPRCDHVFSTTNGDNDHEGLFISEKNRDVIDSLIQEKNFSMYDKRIKENSTRALRCPQCKSITTLEENTKLYRERKDVFESIKSLLVKSIEDEEMREEFPNCAVDELAPKKVDPGSNFDLIIDHFAYFLEKQYGDHEDLKNRIRGLIGIIRHIRVVGAFGKVSDWTWFLQTAERYAGLTKSIEDLEYHKGPCILSTDKKGSS